MSEPAPSTSSLAVGDRVIYPNQGLCVVTDIRDEEVAGQRLVFVNLRFLETGATAKVPRDKLAKNGVRRLSSPDEVKAVARFLTSDSEKASLDWKARARDNTKRLTDGGLLGVTEVVKNLQILSELRPLPTKERGQYNDARHLCVSELAAALEIPDCDAEDLLDVVLFPVGKERPKRTAEEFRIIGEDDLGLEDGLALEGGDEAPAEESEEGEAKDGEEAAEAAEAGDEDEAPAKPAKAPKGEKPAKAAKVDKPPKAEKPAKAKAAKAAKKAPAEKKPKAAKAPKKSAKAKK